MISDDELLDLAHIVAKKLNIELPSDSEIRFKINLHYPQQIIRHNDLYTLWIDKYYIAYEHDNKLYYPYITSHHIYEENRICLEIRRQRKLPTRLPDSVLVIFHHARQHMSRLNIDYIINRRLLIG